MSTLGFRRRSDDPFAHSRRSRSSTSHLKSPPSMHDINAEVSAIKPTNKSGRKRRWSPPSPSTDHVCQGNSFSSQDATERELPPKPKRLARFKSQAVQSSPDIANHRISANGHDLSVAEKQNSSVDLAGTLPSGDSLADHEGSDPPSAIIGLCPDMCPGHAEVSAIKPTNKSGRKWRWSPPSPSTDHVCQGNSSSQDGTKRELPPKAKRLDRFKVRQSQAVESSPDIANLKISANGHDLSVAEKQSSSVDLAGTFPSGNSLADHEGSDPPSAIIGLCPDMCPESERAEQERNEDLDQYERLDGDRKQTSEHLAGQTSCSKHLVHSKESRTIFEDVAYYCQPTSLAVPTPIMQDILPVTASSHLVEIPSPPSVLLKEEEEEHAHTHQEVENCVVPTPIMQDRLPVTASSHLVEIPSPPSVLIKEEEEEHTHTHQEVENCVVVSKQDEEVAKAKLKLILRIWRRRSSKRRESREEMELALSTALNLLSLGPPIEQNELETNACDREEIKRDIVPGSKRFYIPGLQAERESKTFTSQICRPTWKDTTPTRAHANLVEQKLSKLIEESERVHANLVERFSAFEQDIYIPDLQAYMERHNSNSCSNRSDGTAAADASSGVPRAINEYFAARSVPKGPVGESKAARALQDIAMSMRREMAEAKWRRGGSRGVRDDDVLRSILKGPVGESKAARALQEIVTSARAEWRPRYYCKDISSSLSRFPFRKIKGGGRSE